MLPTARRPLRFLAPLAFTALGAGLALLAAGPLNPPAGTVSPSFKTLAEVEPRIAVNATNTPGDNDGTPSLFKITAPGSYYLTGNITGVVGKNGIEIAASGVTLDLNGFEVLGAPGSFVGVTSFGIGFSNVAVLNGSVRNWGLDGVNLVAVTTGRLERVLSSNNSGSGMSTGAAFSITDCNGSRNSVSGISTGRGSTLERCTGFANNNDGIEAGFGNTLTNCTAIENTRRGIAVLSGSIMQGCAVRSNGESGITCAGSCILLSNTAETNTLSGTGAGIEVLGSNNRIEGNNCIDAVVGVRVSGSGNIVLRNCCSGNTSDWVISTGNNYGPILDRRTPASAAASGFSAPTTLNTTDPHANFSY